MRSQEYTLKQAISLYEMCSSHLSDHQVMCEDCNLLKDDPDWTWCENGREAARAVSKWRRRVKKAAEQEGAQMTV